MGKSRTSKKKMQFRKATPGIEDFLHYVSIKFKDKLIDQRKLNNANGAQWNVNNRISSLITYATYIVL